MIKELSRTSVAQKLALFIILSVSGMQLVGCGNCKSSGSPPSVTLTELNGQCILDDNINCTCSGGGALSSCGSGSQTYSLGTAAPGVFPPCPPTFTCNNLPTCTANM